MTAQVLASANRGGRNAPRNARGPKPPKGNGKQAANANAQDQGKDRSHRGLGPAVPGRGVKKEVVAAVEAHVGKQQQVG